MIVYSIEPNIRGLHLFRDVKPHRQMNLAKFYTYWMGKLSEHMNFSAN